MKMNKLAVAVSVAVLGAMVTVPSFAQTTMPKDSGMGMSSDAMSGTYRPSDSWMNDSAARNNGRITRQMYLDEMGRNWDADTNHRGTREAYLTDSGLRWDGMDAGNKGLTPTEMGRMMKNQK